MPVGNVPQIRDKHPKSQYDEKTKVKYPTHNVREVSVAESNGLQTGRHEGCDGQLASEHNQHSYDRTGGIFSASVFTVWASVGKVVIIGPQETTEHPYFQNINK
jgi:hypothetical protein